MKKIARLMRSTKAATAVEYGLLLALIFLAALVAITGTGSKTTLMWNNVADETGAVL